MMKKTIATMLLAVMQSAFAVSLMDGKYINFEEYVREKNLSVYQVKDVIEISVPEKVGCSTLDEYKTKCVNGENWDRRYFSNMDLQKAFVEARNMKGIGVYLPPGVWNFAEQIVVPHGMTLKGSYDRPHNVTQADLHAIANGSDATVTWEYTDGTNIACYHGWGKKVAAYDPSNPDKDACIALRGTATLDGVNVFYPQQEKPRHNEPFEPVPFPWTISCQSGEGFPAHYYPEEEGRNPESLDYLSRCSVINTTLVNSYAGIDLSGANDHYIKGVNMAAFRRGIRLDAITSQGAIEDVNIHHQFSWSFYNLMDLKAGSDDNKMMDSISAFTLNHLIGMDIRRVDWGWINNVFIYKANKGFYFRRGYNGDKEFRSAPSVDIQNSGCDICRDAVYAYEINPGVAVSFSNCNLLGRIKSRTANYGSIRITNSHLAFEASSYGARKVGDKNLYDRNHIEVAAHTTLQITNSEILDYVGDPIGLWQGSTFDVRGNLFIDNTVLVWLDTKGFNFKEQKINGETVYPVLHFREHSDAIIVTDNLLLRGPEDLRSDRRSGDGKPRHVRQTNTYRDPLETGYFPGVKPLEELTALEESEYSD